MTEPPKQPSTQEQQPTAQDYEVAAEIAVALATTNPTAHAIGLILLPLIPLDILHAPDGHNHAAAIAAVVARKVVEDRPTRTPAQPAEASVDTLEDKLMRGMYATAALERLAEGYRQGKLDEAIQAEDRFFAQHQEAEQRRIVAREKRDAAIAKHGNILGWHHLNQTKTHRPSHLAAHRKNFDPMHPPKSTGGLPGFLPGCDCEAGPPWPNAEMLN